MKKMIDKRIFHYLLLLFLICIGGCSNNNKNNIKNKTINGKKTYYVNVDNSGILTLPEISSDINYIKLQTTSKSLINYIDKFKVYKDRFFIYNAKAKSIVCFTHDGKLEFVINNHGRGPGQYLEITDYIINIYENTVEILDNGTSKIFKYDFRGNFINSKKCIFFAENFTKYDSLSYVFYAGNDSKCDYNLFFTNNNLEITKKVFPIDKELAGFSIENPTSFYLYKSDICFNYIFSNIIYVLNKQSVKPKYSIDFGKNNLPADFFEILGDAKKTSPYERMLGQRKVMKLLSEKKYCSFPNNFSESDNYIFFQFNNGNKFSYCLISKETDTPIIGDKMLFDSDIALKVYPLAIYNDKLFTYIQPFELNKLFDNMENTFSEDQMNEFIGNNKLVKSLMELNFGLKKFDNPILVKLTLKKF